MSDLELVARYNYDHFIPEKFEPLDRFELSPPLGKPGPDFPRFRLDGDETGLHALLKEQPYTVVEFGSFT